MIPLVVKLHVERASLKQRLLHHVDWVGSTIFIVSTGSFLIGTSWGGAQYPWDSWRTLVPIFMGVFGVVFTLLWEIYAAKAPFIRMHLFKAQGSIMAYSCAILQGFLVCEIAPPFARCTNQIGRCSASSTIFPSTSNPPKISTQRSPASLSCPSVSLFSQHRLL
jgi:hypothetical protein